jgi:hypothetical protein
METNAPILFRLVQCKVKIIEFDLVVVFVENPTADVGWTMRMIRTPVISAVEKTADANAQSLFQSAFAIGDGTIKGTDATV